jgi:beta-lactam-binding protein with PASTA domain
MASLLRATMVAVLVAAALVGCGSATPSATVPNVVGQTLDAAKSVLVTAGFPAESQDLLRGRNPLLDSDWTVCTQTPGPVAAAAAGSTVDLGVVKKAETCPDAGAAVAPSSGVRTRASAVPTTHAARPSAESRPASTSKAQAARPTGGNGSGGNGGTGAGAGAPVRSGAFCDPPASGISESGTAMVCAPAADGRNRWKRA